MHPLWKEPDVPALSRRGVIWMAGALGMIQSARGQPAGKSLVIRAEFSSDRDQTGTLVLEDSAGQKLAGPFLAYGRSDSGVAAIHNNPTRDPTLKYGDTPTGTFSVPRAIATGDGTTYASHSYGPNGALVLQPTAGDALVASQNGRIGLLIHSGDPGSNNKLRATHGCVRLSNSDMAALMQAISKAGENATFNRCEVTRIDASIGPPGDPNAGEDAGDPPPGISGLLSPGPIIP